MILVTGAAGKTGRTVIKALSDRGEPVRAVVRLPEQVEQVVADGAIETEVADLLDPGSLAPAFAGMRAVYHICPNLHPSETSIGMNAIAAAQAAEIPHFVLHSVLHPQTEAMPHHWSKLRVEEALIDSDLGYTILQPASYTQNVRAVWSSVVEAGRYPVPYPVNVRFSPVDLRDVAELAAGVLSDPGHEGAIYELAGPELLTAAQMAERMGKVIGKPVEAVEVDLADWQHDSTLEGERLQIVLAMFRYYAQHGFWGNPRVLAGLLRREPTTFQRVVKRIHKRGG